MKTKWTKTARQIVIEQGMPRAARLFAIPLLLIAAYLGYQLLGALADNFRAGTVRAWTESALGLVLLAALFVAFAAPGLFLFLGNKRVTVDAERGEVVEEMRWLTLARATRYSTEPYRAVRIDYEVETTKNPGSRRAVLFTFDVTLVDARDRRRLVAMFRVSELAQARALGKDLADLLQLKLADHSGKWDPAARGKIPEDIQPIREWLEKRGWRGRPLDAATWVARGVHFLLDQILRNT